MPPRCYSLYAGKPETEAEYREFLADHSSHLRLLLCINRLNEGIHVPAESFELLRACYAEGENCSSAAMAVPARMRSISLAN